MSEVLSDLKRAKEEEYFRKKEAELLAKVRERAASQKVRQDLADELGVSDEEVLGLLQDLGFSRDTVRLLHVVPLLEVAWADGEVSGAERGKILESARHHGIAEGSSPDNLLASWLTSKPSADFFERARATIGSLLGGLPEEDRRKGAEHLAVMAQQVANASRGFLGLGKRISPEEEAALSKLSEELAKAHPEAAQKVLGG
jgi:hypothetical protein